MNDYDTDIAAENADLRAEVMRLQMALANIVAIELEYYAGDDFSEIREAQAIANRALNGDDE